MFNTTKPHTIKDFLHHYHVINTLELDLTKCLADTLITESMFDHPEHDVSNQDLFTFYRNVNQLYDNAYIGILMGESFCLHSDGVLGLAHCSAINLNQAIQLTIDHPILADLEFDFSRITQNGQTTLRLTPKAEDILFFQNLDNDNIFDFLCNYKTAGIYKAIREISLISPQLSSVKLMHNDTIQRVKYEHFFGCPVTFNASANEIVFLEKYLTNPLARSDPITFKFLQQKCTQLEHSLDKKNSFTNKVISLLSSQENKTWSVQYIAETLHVSPRTLKRKLELEGTCFRQLMNNVKLSLAKVQLTNSSLKISTIAFSLGYRNSTSFTQAFKSWIGITPIRYRNENTK